MAETKVTLNEIDTTTPIYGQIGYADTTTQQTNISAANLTGLSVTVSIPAGRRIKITSYVDFSNNVANTYGELTVKEGTTELGKSRQTVTFIGSLASCTTTVYLSPSAGSHTYNSNLAFYSGQGATSVSGTKPFIAVELV